MVYCVVLFVRFVCCLVVWLCCLFEFVGFCDVVVDDDCLFGDLVGVV